MCKPVSVLFLKHFMNGCRYLSGGKMKWSCFWIASVHIALYVRPPLCSLMYRPPSNEDNTSLWLMQHSFLLKSPPTWLAISVSVFALIGGKREVGGDTDHSFQTAYFNVHPSRGRNTVEMCVCVCVCVYAWGVCDKIGARLSAVWLLQDRVELPPIFTAERDVGRHLPRHLWSHPRRLTAQVSVNLTDWQEDLYIWCHHRRMMKCPACKCGDNWADGTLTSGSVVAS